MHCLTLITQVFVYLYVCRSWLWSCITLFTQVFVCLYVGEPVDTCRYCIAVVVSDMAEVKLHLSTATVEDLRKIKQVGHARAHLIIDRRDELGGCNEY